MFANESRIRKSWVHSENVEQWLEKFCLFACGLHWVWPVWPCIFNKEIMGNCVDWVKNCNVWDDCSCDRTHVHSGAAWCPPWSQPWSHSLSSLSHVTCLWQMYVCKLQVTLCNRTRDSDKWGWSTLLCHCIWWYRGDLLAAYPPDPKLTNNILLKPVFLNTLLPVQWNLLLATLFLFRLQTLRKSVGTRHNYVEVF